MRQRRELIEPTLAEHHGKLINYAGDGFLAMFDSPVEAVRCAIVIHQSMVARNASLPREQWILYRIGVHLGDVIVEPDGVFGDGVNIAARLEGIATPGDLFISGGVYEQIKNKLVCAYQSLGDRQVKNITDPVTVYRVLPDPAALSQARRKRWPVALLAVLIFSFSFPFPPPPLSAPPPFTSYTTNHPSSCCSNLPSSSATSAKPARSWLQPRQLLPFKNSTQRRRAGVAEISRKSRC